MPKGNSNTSGDGSWTDKFVKYIFLVCNWIAGLFFIVLGILHLFTSIAAGASFLLIALFLFPPIRRRVYAVSKWSVPTKARIILVLMLFVTGSGFFLYEEHQREERERVALAEERERERSQRAQARSVDSRKARIQSQFTFWSGAHRNLENTIKRSMNDPRSYRHVKTTYSDQGDHLTVRTTFRGRNAFGGVVTRTVYAKVSLDGDVIQVSGL